MRFTTLIFLAIAIGCYFVGHSLEVRGDGAPLAEHGISSARAKYHLAALLAMLAALGFFIAAAVSLFRRKRD